MSTAAGLLAVLAAVSSYGTDATQWQALSGTPEDAIAVTVIESTVERLVFDVEVPGFYMFDYPLGSEVYDRLLFPDLRLGGSHFPVTMYGEEGLPELPVLPVRITMPHGSDLSVRVAESELSEFTDVVVYPLCG